MGLRAPPAAPGACGPCSGRSAGVRASAGPCSWSAPCSAAAAGGSGGSRPRWSASPGGRGRARGGAHGRPVDLRGRARGAERRVTAGERVGGRVEVRSTARGRLLPARIELPVGRQVADFPLPSLRPGAGPRGPVRDPDHAALGRHGRPGALGARRPVGAGRAAGGLDRHRRGLRAPRLVPLAGAAAGVLRDLEGQATRVVSDSDLSFHALRDYVPGDDRRHIHWKTTARTGTLMVRQFEDTRRTHTAVALATAPGRLPRRRRVRARRRGRRVDRRAGAAGRARPDLPRRARGCAPRTRAAARRRRPAARRARAQGRLGAGAVGRVGAAPTRRWWSWSPGRSPTGRRCGSPPTGSRPACRPCC